MINQELYTEIKSVFPLNAVELIVYNNENKLLMFKRANEPAKDQWWIPGGRVWFAENRIDAAARLLKTECGIVQYDIDEVGMYEYTVKDNTSGSHQHTITTVYKITGVQNSITMDSQSSEYAWKYAYEWKDLVQHDFIKHLVTNQAQATDPPSFVTISPENSSGFIKNELYTVILETLSIPCVDILIKNKKGEILLVKRKNEPAKDFWWVPGGRVLHGEKRCDTAARKLQEECGLQANNFNQIGNFEFIFNTSQDKVYHDIATLYEVTVDETEVMLDTQSSEYSWKMAAEWLQLSLNPFIRDVLENNILKGKENKVYN